MAKPVDFEPAMRRALEGRTVRLFERCTSTNDEARAWALAQAPHLALVVADAQDSGRGRHGRTWIAGAGDALLCSVVIRPRFEPRRWGLVPLITGFAVSQACRRRAGVEVRLKWPNDLLAHDRKLGGILCEAEPPSFVVCGIGINVSSAPAGFEATSLAEQRAVRLDRADLVAAILTELEAVLGDPDEGLERWRASSATLGRAVRVALTDATVIEGDAIDVDACGGLVVRDADGALRIVYAGDVEHLRQVQ